MICITQYTTAGKTYLVVVSPQPTDLTTCSLVAGSYQETFALPIFNITEAQGAEISGAILLVWAIAFGFRMVVKSLNVGNSEKETES